MLRRTQRHLPRHACRVVAAALLLFCSSTAHTTAQTQEVRALWVVRTTLTSPDGVTAMVSSAKASGFNTLVVQVRGRADAYYQHGLEPRPPALIKQATFDPLAMTIARAHDAGMRVHAWVNINLVSGAVELPASRDHIVYRHPEWLMVPKALAHELSGIDSSRPEYLEQIARYVRGQPESLEGIYMSPIPPESAKYTIEVVRDIVRRYDLDGVHLDYVRYPSADFDYSRASLLEFRKDVVRDLTPAEQRTYDARMAASPTFYAEMFPERWRGFRMSRLSTLVAQLRTTIKTARPAAIVSAAVVPDSAAAATHRLQNWRDWLTQGLLDVVCPMAYTTDPNVFATQIAAARDLAGSRSLWAGIGAYRMLPAQVVAAVNTARRERADGVILFSYDSLVDPANSADYLAEVGRGAFGSQ